MSNDNKNDNLNTPGSQKKAHHPEGLKNEMIQRLNRIEGQIRGIGRMIAEDIYCDDVIHQILSVEAALSGVKKTLLEAHMKGCVIRQIQDGELEVVDELMITMKKLIRS